MINNEDLLMKFKSGQKYKVQKLTNRVIFNFGKLLLVNNENQCIGYVKKFHTYVLNHDMFKKEIIDKEQYNSYDLTKGQADKMYNSFDGKFYVKEIKDLSLFKKPVNLVKPVRGERLTTEDEKSVIDYNIVEDLFNHHEVSFHEILWGTPLYNEVYSICMDLDMLEAFFEYTTK